MKHGFCKGKWQETMDFPLKNYQAADGPRRCPPEGIWFGKRPRIWSSSRRRSGGKSSETRYISYEILKNDKTCFFRKIILKWRMENPMKMIIKKCERDIYIYIYVCVICIYIWANHVPYSCWQMLANLAVAKHFIILVAIPTPECFNGLFLVFNLTFAIFCSGNQCTTASVDIQFTKISGFELMQLLKILALSKWLEFLRLQYLAKFWVKSGCIYIITNCIVGAWNVLKRLETYWSVLKRISPIFWMLDSPISDFQDIPKISPNGIDHADSWNQETCFNGRSILGFGLRLSVSSTLLSYM